MPYTNFESRILQATIGGLLLFIGICMQLWAANNVSDIPLSTLCTAYSGTGDVMTVNDFNALYNWWVMFVLQVCVCKIRMQSS